MVTFVCSNYTTAKKKTRKKNDYYVFDKDGSRVYRGKIYCRVDRDFYDQIMMVKIAITAVNGKLPS